MYPPPFEYVRPGSLEEALDILSEAAGAGDEVKVLAGGQSLIPLMKLRFAAPARLVDINRVGGLSGIRQEDGRLRVGALSRHNDLADAGILHRRCPVMAAAAPLVADPLVRNLGTIGGSLAHADPAGDWGAVVLALGAEIVARSARGERVIPARDFFVDTFTTALHPDEIVTEVRIPEPAGSRGGDYLKLERKVGDFATVGVAVNLEVADGRVRRAGIGLTAVGPTNIHAADAGALLEAAEPGPELFAEAARLAAAAADPVSDVRGSAEYKRAAVETFVRRGLENALRSAQAA